MSNSVSVQFKNNEERNFFIGFLESNFVGNAEYNGDCIKVDEKGLPVPKKKTIVSFLLNDKKKRRDLIEITKEKQGCFDN